MVNEAVGIQAARRLVGGSCGACGATYFPFQTYGCEHCGAAGDALTERMLSGTGRLRAAATVHHHPDPHRPPPFTVVEVALHEGVALRGVYDGDPADLRRDMALAARFVPGRRDGKRELHFVRAD